jgi:hypothetical protein
MWRAVVFTICAASVLGARPVQPDSVQARRLNSRIGPANLQRYKSIRNTKDWDNPSLVIRREGIEIIAKGVPSGRQTVAAADLRRTLIELPVTAWPYGRVVVVQEIGIREPGGNDEQRIADNLNVALATLKTLQVTVVSWPSA